MWSGLLTRTILDCNRSKELWRSRKQTNSITLALNLATIDCYGQATHALERSMALFDS